MSYGDFMGAEPHADERGRHTGNSELKALRQQLAETEIAAETYRAQLMACRDELVTLRHTYQRRERGFMIQLGAVLGVEVDSVIGGIHALGKQYRKLLDGYPEGMTPTDVEKLKAANAELAAKETDYCNHIAEVDRKVHQLTHRLTRLTICGREVFEAEQNGTKGDLCVALCGLLGVLNGAPKDDEIAQAVDQQKQIAELTAQNEKLRARVSDIESAAEPFEKAFEKVRAAMSKPTDQDLQDFLDRNEIVPAGTCVGNWRRLADVVASSPRQSLADIEAQAAENILRDLKRDTPETNPALHIFQRMQLRIDVLRGKHKETPA